MKNGVFALGLINLEGEYKDTGLPMLAQKPIIPHDAVLFAEGDLETNINQVMEQQEVISSRWLVIDNVLLNRSHANGSSEIAFLEARYCQDNSLVAELMRDPLVGMVLSTKGIYDFVVVRKSSPNKGQLRDILRTNPFVRSFVVSESGDNHSLSILPARPLEINLTGRNYRGFNKYEGPVRYANNPNINQHYFEQCRRIAEDIVESCNDLSSTVIYAPIRGAKPIIEVVMEFLKHSLGEKTLPTVLYPVTSSFVRYPSSKGAFSKNGKSPVSGRYGNVLELRRLTRRLEGVDRLIYIDEIVSGGMMVGHCIEMVGSKRMHKSPDRYQGTLDEGILLGNVRNGLEVCVYGLADAMGSKFRLENARKLEELHKRGLVRFKFFPTRRLVTEDQRYLLGLHYLDYGQGPSSVPMINGANYFQDKQNFQKDFIDRGIIV